MARRTRKYEYYVVAMDADNAETYEDYRNAFARYSKAESATLYGMENAFAEMSVIMSK